MKPAVTPVALDYIHSSLEQAGFIVSILDLAFSENLESDIKAAFQHDDYLLVGVTIRNTDDCYFASQDFCLEKYKRIIDYVKSYTNSQLVLGGVGFSVMPEAVMEYLDAELAVAGEGELALGQLANALGSNRDPRQLPGLVFKELGKYRRNPGQYLELAELDLASRSGIDNRRYHLEGGQVGFETKRGCNQACVYCADPLSKGRKIRLRPPGQIAQELENLYHQGVENFHTCDSEFNLPPGHALEVCQQIIQRGLGEKIRWYAYAAPVPFDESLASAMKKAGCAGIDFGVDHANAEILKNLGRNFDSAHLKRTAGICKKLELPFMYDLLLGGPGETRATLKETVEKMKVLDPSRVGISLGIRLYPGSSLANQIGNGEDNPKNGGEYSVSSQESLWGELEDNAHLLKPVFYLSSKLGDDVEDYLQELVGSDSRFFFGRREQTGRSYNYNDNSQLVQAIRNGYRGAFWDILRRIQTIQQT